VLAGTVLIGVGFDRFVEIWNQRNRWLSAIDGFALAGGLVASAVAEASFYYVDYARRDPDAYQGAIARYVAALPEGERLIVRPVPRAPDWRWRSARRWSARTRPARCIARPRR